MKVFIEQKLLSPIKALLKQGISVKELSLCISLGSCIGLFPIIGSTTVLCLLVAYLFKLNIVLIQIINYLMYPLQLTMIFPFVMVGNLILRGKNDLNLINFIDLLQIDFFKALLNFGDILFAAMLGWVIISPLIFLVVYYVSRIILKQCIKKVN